MKVALGWAYWAAYQALSLVLGAIGLVAIYFLARFDHITTRKSRLPTFEDRTVMCFKGRWTEAWNNDEDGIDGIWQHYQWSAGTRVWQWIYQWSAIRNFSNGLRRLPGAFYVVTKDDKVAVRITKNGSVTTCGWRQCIVWRGIRFGFLIQPNATAGYRVWPVAGKA